MRLLTPLLLTLLTLLSSVSAITSPTSYCKCICFENSTIIPLNSPPDTSNTRSLHPNLLRRDDGETTTDTDTGGKKHHTLTCNDCNRAFCLDYNLPICKNAKEEDVFATCFQRDSLKDRTIVTIFLLATAGLILWALLKPFVVIPSTAGLVQKYGDRMGVGLRGSADSDGLPGPGASGGGSGSGRGGFGRDVSPRTGRGAAGGRGSISRQGGLNS